MRIDMVGRHVDVTPALRRFTAEKLAKLEKLLDEPLEAHVVLAIEKHRHTAEIQVKSRRGVFAGARETDDLYHSIGEVVDKLLTQAHKRKDKLTVRKRRDGRKAGAVAEAAAPEETKAAPRARSRAKRPTLLRVPRYRLKPLSAEDAAAELEASGAEVLVYRDAESYRVNVVFRRKGGGLGLVDPEF